MTDLVDRIKAGATDRGTADEVLLRLGWHKETVRGLASMHEVFHTPSDQTIDALDAPNPLANLQDADNNAPACFTYIKFYYLPESDQWKCEAFDDRGSKGVASWDGIAKTKAAALTLAILEYMEQRDG